MSCFKQNRPEGIEENDWAVIELPTLMDLFLLPETTNEMRIEILNKALNTIKCVYLENGFTLEQLGSNIDKANNFLKEAFENPTPETVAFIPSALASFVFARDLDTIVAEYKDKTNNPNPLPQVKKAYLALAMLAGSARGKSLFNAVLNTPAYEAEMDSLVAAIKAGNKVDTATYELSGGANELSKNNKKDGGMAGYHVWLWGGVVAVLGGAYLLMRKK